MKFRYGWVMILGLAACVQFAGPGADTAQAAFRQYYSGWSYAPSRGYYYRKYFYKPTPSYPSYKYHYCIHYPSQPRYVYYYNPVQKVYWGRCDLQGTAGKRYSLLAEKDRKPKLKEIPATAFPEPAEMPTIPESTDGTRIEPPQDLPEDDAPAP